MPFGRVRGWIERYSARHPGTVWTVDEKGAAAVSPDDSRALLSVPIGTLLNHSVDGFVDHVEKPWRIGLLVVRKGGFAVVRLRGDEVLDRKVGRRHVQGKTKAGGWSQQRFARRRENQARAAYDAAAGHAADLLLPHAAELDQLVTAGDQGAVDAVLATRELAPLLGVPGRWLAGVGEPDRSVVDAAVGSARSVPVTITDTTPR